MLFGEKSKRSARAILRHGGRLLKDNEGYDWFGKPLVLLRVPFPMLDKPPWARGTGGREHERAMWHIARFVGAHPAMRDPVDRRIVSMPSAAPRIRSTARRKSADIQIQKP